MKEERKKEVGSTSLTEQEIASQARNDEGVTQTPEQKEEKPKRKLWQTSDGFGFESKNFAENHAKILPNKEVKEMNY